MELLHTYTGTYALAVAAAAPCGATVAQATAAGGFAMDAQPRAHPDDVAALVGRVAVVAADAVGEAGC